METGDVSAIVVHGGALGALFDAVSNAESQ